MLKPAPQGVDRGRAKSGLRVVDVKVLPSRDSIAFVSQRASPATYAWVKVDGVQNYESRLADLLICKILFADYTREVFCTFLHKSTSYVCQSSLYRPFFCHGFLGPVQCNMRALCNS